MIGIVSLATIQRPGGSEVRITTEPHPQSGGRMVVIAQVRADSSAGPRIALRPTEIEKVASALSTAAAMLCGNGENNHRTVVAADVARQIAEDRKLF